MNIASLGEFGLIRKISRLTAKSKDVILGIGDDTAAVVPTSLRNLLLLTCDSVIENIHFDTKATPFQIGRKAMARNLSDIAAMGGTPRYALVAAALPSTLSEKSALGIYKGLEAIARKYKTRIIGGDTSRSRAGIHLSVTIIGEVPRNELLSRRGARVGDIACVTGTLGGSIHGKHLFFEPLIAEGRFLAQRFHPTSMMDVSDGLASDLQRLREQSGVGFEIFGDMLPVSPALKSRKLSRSHEIAHAMQDGEDYELLFTIPKHRLPALQKAWKKRFRLPLTPIGVVRNKRFGIQIRTAGKKRSISAANDHFASIQDEANP